MTDPCQFLDQAHPVVQVLNALAEAAVDGGCVDLLSCSVLKTWACPVKAWPTLKSFGAIEERTATRFAACTHALSAADPLRSDDEWPMETNDSISIKQAYFVPHDDGVVEDGRTQRWPERRLSFSDEQIAYARAHSDLVRIAPVRHHYIFGVLLGRGSFATVRQATRRAHPTPTYELIPRHVAIKAIDKVKTDDLRAIKKEVVVMASASHPHIIQLYEIFDATTTLYIVMELARGGDVFDRIARRGTHTERDASQAVRQLCSALAHVHARGIIHRDLKPENLLYATPLDGSPIKDPPATPVLPPPPALEVEPPATPTVPPPPAVEVHSPTLRPRRTAVSTVPGVSKSPELAKRVTWADRKELVGTPPYMAPEVITHRVYTSGCDMWAVGVILFFSLSGEPPFAGRDVQALFARIRAGAYNRCEGRGWAGVSAEAKDLIKALLVPDPRKRLSAEAVLKHPWIKDSAIAQAASYRLEEDGGLARLQMNREATRQLSGLTLAARSPSPTVKLP